MCVFSEQNKYADINKYKITGLKAGTKYTFAVKAYKMTESEIKRAKTFTKGTFMTAPALPSITKISRGYTSLKLNWKAGAGTTGYRVYIKKNGKWVQLIKATKAKTYTVKGLSAGKKYEFAIRPYRIEGKKVIWADAYTQCSATTVAKKKK